MSEIKKLKKMKLKYFSKLTDELVQFRFVVGFHFINAKFLYFMLQFFSVSEARLLVSMPWIMSSQLNSRLLN